MVDPDEQNSHTREAQALFASTYSLSFEIPQVTVQLSLPPSPVKSRLLSDSMEPSSEIGSVLEELDFKVCHFLHTECYG